MKIFQALFCTLLIIVIAGNITVQAQSAGIYSTYEDFLQHKLTYPVNCSNQKDRLKLNELLGSSTGYVVSNGEKHAFNKGKVFGYNTCTNESYRFCNSEAFRIMDTAGFYIYYQNKIILQSGGKGSLRRDCYFFSTGGDNLIQPLTISNVKRAFPGNHSFHYLLDAYFRSDKELAAYDDYQKMYKIEYLYKQSFRKMKRQPV
jgi:hypothetical protein